MDRQFSLISNLTAIVIICIVIFAFSCAYLPDADMRQQEKVDSDLKEVTFSLLKKQLERQGQYVNRLKGEIANYRESFRVMGINPDEVVKAPIPPGVLEAIPAPAPDEPHTRRESFRKDGGGAL